MTRRDAASEGRTLRWGATGQKHQWPWSIGGSRRLIAHTGTRCLMAHRRGRAKPSRFHSYPNLYIAYLFSGPCTQSKKEMIDLHTLKMTNCTHFTSRLAQRGAMTGANQRKSNKDPSAKNSTTGVVYAQISKFASQYHKAPSLPFISVCGDSSRL